MSRSFECDCFGLLWDIVVIRFPFPFGSFCLYRMMDVKRRTAFKKLVRAPYGSHCQSSTHGSVGICKFWLAGNCTKNPCRFLHSATPTPNGHRNNTWSRNHSSMKQSHISERKNPTIISPTKSDKKCHATQQSHEQDSRINAANQECHCVPENENVVGSNEKTNAASKRICEYWITGNCVHGDKCRDINSWYSGDGFSLLNQLEGHKKAVTGIVLPSGSDKLFSGSKDGTVGVWNCHTGQCDDVIDMGSEVGCLYSEGPWVFAGLTNAVKAFNIQTHTNLTLSGPVGLVYAIEVGGDLLFAGAHDGAISAWKFNHVTSAFELIASLEGHSGAVVSLVVGAGRLYSGSIDKTVRRWDLTTMQCMQTLTGHSQVVTSVLCWDVCLLSCSLDRKLKVWTAKEDRSLEEYYMHEEEHGIIALNGMRDSEGKSILFCSCDDNSVRLYELPSLMETGRIFSRQGVRAMQTGPGCLFFTGDGTGRISVWKLLEKPSTCNC